MNRQLLANWLKTISLSIALVFGAFGQGYAQEARFRLWYSSRSKALNQGRQTPPELKQSVYSKKANTPFS